MRVYIDKIMGGIARDADSGTTGTGTGEIQITWNDFLINNETALNTWLTENYPFINSPVTWNEFVTNEGANIQTWLGDVFQNLVQEITWEDFLLQFDTDLRQWLTTNYPTIETPITWEDFITNFGGDLLTWLTTNYPLEETFTWNDFITNFSNELHTWLTENFTFSDEPITWEEFITNFGNELLNWLTINHPGATWEEFITNFGDALTDWITNNFPAITTNWEDFITAFGDDLRQWLTENYPWIDTPTGDTIINEGDVIEIINEYLSTYNGTRLISGTVTWIENLDFELSVLVYEILGRRASSEQTILTIPPNTADDPMYAVIYANLAGKTGYILGTPAPNPAVPIVNQNNQIAITTIFIPANSTEPGPDPDGNEIVNEIIYDENIEWVTTKAEPAGFTINFDDLTNPASGVKNIEVAIAGTEGDPTYERLGGMIKTPIEISPELLMTLPVDYIGAKGMVLPTLDITTNQIFADNQSQVTEAGITTIAYYGFDWPKKPIAYFRNLATGLVYTMVYALYDIEQITVFGTSLTNNTFHFYANPDTIPAGDYAITFTNFIKREFKFIAIPGFNTTTGDAQMIFTRAAGPVEAKDGNIIFSLETALAWLNNAGLLFEIYNGATLAGTFNFAGNTNGLTEPTGDYSRFTIPIASFNPSQTTIDKLVIRTLGNWPPLSVINLDNIILQTGVILPDDPEKPLTLGDWIEDQTFDYRDAANGMIYPIDPLASFDYRIIEVVLYCNEGTAITNLKINGTAEASNLDAATLVTQHPAAIVVKKDDVVDLEITAIADATAIWGKLKYVRI